MKQREMFAKNRAERKQKIVQFFKGVLRSRTSPKNTAATIDPDAPEENKRGYSTRYKRNRIIEDHVHDIQLLGGAIRYVNFIRDSLEIVEKKLQTDDTLTVKVWHLFEQYYMDKRKNEDTVLFKSILQVSGIEMIEREPLLIFNCEGLFNDKIYEIKPGENTSLK